MILRLIFGGQSFLKEELEDEDCDDKSQAQDKTQTRIISIAQDIVFNFTGVDTTLAECTLKGMDPEIGAVTPPHFVPNHFIHFRCDNFDINDSNFDGKNSLHAT
ncbi:hypothetical protein E2C01_063619 [Portunus trituberculatus]|uniref:Uncharacterized protein n=1 Tax=Portunus trituberculatus TaxID=210409 RepID=A0A5B7HHJ3_PORTR|nr:hypothetical protein [Portunus trituberculatus]